MPRSTADSLREQINRANEQSLRRKRTDEPGKVSQSRPAGAPQRSAAVPPQSGREPSAQPKQTAQGQNAVRQTGAMPNPNRQTAQDPNRSSGQNEQKMRPETVQNSQKPVAGGRQSQNPAGTGSDISGASQPNGQNMPVRQPAMQNGQNAPVRQTPAQNGQNIPMQRSSSKPQSGGANSPAAGIRPQAAAGSSRYDDNTRLTDISTIQRTNGQTPVKRQQVKQKNTPKMPQFQRTEVVYEDEGGNTIVSIVKAVLYMIFVVVASVFLAIGIISVGNDVFAFVKNDVSIDVRIPEYATLDDITEILYENEVIEYPTVFKLYAQLKKDVDDFLAGDYVVSPNMSYDDLRDHFKPQPKIGISEITIPEGYTTDEIIDLMVSYGIGTREGYIDAIQNYDFDYWFLDELEEDMDENRIYRLDGYLFPDTYQFYNSSSEVTVLNKLLKRFGQIFKEEYRIQAESMGYTVDEIINLAAMIEKEAGTPSEFFKVSSVFHNRLNNWTSRPMLESDATIVYAIQHETGERPQLTSTDYATPYNTYTYAGLPPGPIANPSASAMLAALSPADTNYYYFVSDGNISYFAETKEQHQIFIEEIKKGTIRDYVTNMGDAGAAQ